jgi:hypothetical protein
MGAIVAYSGFAICGFAIAASSGNTYRITMSVTWSSNLR